MKVKSLSRVQLLWPHGLEPTRYLHPWDFPGKNTGVGCHCLLHQIALNLFKLANSKSVYPAYPVLPSPSHENYNIGSRPCYPFASCLTPGAFLGGLVWHTMPAVSKDLWDMPSWQWFPYLYVLPYLIETNPGHTLKQKSLPNFIHSQQKGVKWKALSRVQLFATPWTI